MERGEPTFHVVGILITHEVAEGIEHLNVYHQSGHEKELYMPVVVGR